jgi:polyisoprenoid-binding protein YceI
MNGRVKGIIVAGVLAAGAVLLGNAGPTGKPALAAATAAKIPATGTWTVDPAHTSINFAIRHFGISLVHGRFDTFSGTIVADEAQPEKSSVEFTIQANSVDTNVKMRDDDLRSANYFDVAKYPEITFKSTSVKTAKHGEYVAVGDLTIHGVTKQISLPFKPYGPIKDSFGGTRGGLVTHIQLNRLDFGVGGSTVLENGSLDIGKEVDVDISLEAVPAKPAAG